ERQIGHTRERRQATALVDFPATALGGCPQEHRLADPRLADHGYRPAQLEPVPQKPDLPLSADEHRHIFRRGHEWRNCRVNYLRLRRSVNAVNKPLTCVCGAVLSADSGEELLEQVEAHLDLEHGPAHKNRRALTPMELRV